MCLTMEASLKDALHFLSLVCAAVCLPRSRGGAVDAADPGDDALADDDDDDDDDDNDNDDNDDDDDDDDALQRRGLLGDENASLDR